MMNQYYVPLNIKTKNVLRPDWENIKEIQEFGIRKYPRAEIKSLLNPSFFYVLDTVLPIYTMTVFTTGPNFTTETHIDIAEIHNGEVLIGCHAINLVVHKGPEIGYMRWYKSKKDDGLDVTYTPANTPKLGFEKSNLDLVEEHQINEYVTLVRTDVPHDIETFNSTRICFSIRFKYNDTYKHWENAVSMVSKAFHLSC